MKRLDKLVRDRIPEMIQAEGRPCEVEVLEGEDFDHALRAKLVEEAQEVAGTDTREALMLELADVLEVVETLMAWHGIEEEEVRGVQHARRTERGGFEKHLWVGAVGET
jgi:predicted house-cleaning noncanonical NTP pyrophosphatase (MazG superfamily)